jgi:hypothetical protein
VPARVLLRVDSCDVEVLFGDGGRWPASVVCGVRAVDVFAAGRSRPVRGGPRGALELRAEVGALHVRADEGPPVLLVLAPLTEVADDAPAALRVDFMRETSAGSATPMPMLRIGLAPLRLCVAPESFTRLYRVGWAIVEQTLTAPSAPRPVATSTRSEGGGGETGSGDEGGGGSSDAAAVGGGGEHGGRALQVEVGEFTLETWLLLANEPSGDAVAAGDSPGAAVVAESDAASATGRLGLCICLEPSATLIQRDAHAQQHVQIGHPRTFFGRVPAGGAAVGTSGGEAAEAPLLGPTHVRVHATLSGGSGAGDQHSGARTLSLSLQLEPATVALSALQLHLLGAMRSGFAAAAAAAFPGGGGFVIKLPPPPFDIELELAADAIEARVCGARHAARPLVNLGIGATAVSYSQALAGAVRRSLSLSSSAALQLWSRASHAWEPLLEACSLSAQARQQREGKWSAHCECVSPLELSLSDAMLGAPCL